jgi:uncharacterized membrane protein
MRVASVGHLVFAAVIIVLGIVGLVKGDFAPVWDPVPKGVPARGLLAYLCAFIFLASGIALLLQRTAAPASCLLLTSLLVWLLVFRVPVVLRSPTVVVSWEGCGETVVIVAAAWVLYARFAADWDRRLGFATGDRGLRIARTLYGLALVAFGLAHFAYLKETAALVPAWLPAHTAWVKFTGATYVAAGLAVVTGVYARLGASLAALQMGVFTLLVWVPIVATGSTDASQWSETLVSLALSAGGWVVADSYRGKRWLATGAR